MNNTLINTLSDTKILRLGSILRYNNKHRNHEENVAEHSFYVMHMVNEICLHYNLSSYTRDYCLQLALVHDIPEAITGDISFDTKDCNDELSKIVNKAENEAILKEFPIYQELYKDFLRQEKNRTVSYLIVKIADTASVVKYAELEKDLGNNTPEFVEIRYNARERLIKLIDELEGKLQ